MTAERRLARIGRMGAARGEHVVVDDRNPVNSHVRPSCGTFRGFRHDDRIEADEPVRERNLRRAMFRSARRRHGRENGTTQGPATRICPAPSTPTSATISSIRSVHGPDRVLVLASASSSVPGPGAAAHAVATAKVDPPWTNAAIGDQSAPWYVQPEISIVARIVASVAEN